jgi:hypothetical protein
MDKFTVSNTGDDPNGFAPHDNNLFGMEKSVLDTPRSLTEISGT